MTRRRLALGAETAYDRWDARRRKWERTPEKLARIAMLLDAGQTPGEIAADFAIDWPREKALSSLVAICNELRPSRRARGIGIIGPAIRHPMGTWA